MFFRQISDPNLAQYSYLVGCQKTGEAIVIDPQRDFDQYTRLAAAEGLKLVAATETHIHADYLSGVYEMARELGVRAYLSAEGGEDWSYRWAKEEGIESVLLKHGDRFDLGGVSFEAVHTPGHTPEHLSFLITDRGAGADQPLGLASGDFVFVGSLGRPDLLETAAGEVGAQEPAARDLHRSVQGFLEYPDFLQVWPGHGAGSACGKALGAVPETTVGYERRFNASIQAAVEGVDVFVDSILEGQVEPPLYFSRMKRWNRDGPPRLGGLPVPFRLSAQELANVPSSEASVVIDTRADRGAFMAGHLKGSLWAPLGKNFPTLAGSFIAPEADIHLIVDPAECEAAVRQLIHVGLDRVVGWTDSAELAELLAETPAKSSSIPVIGFSGLRVDPSLATLDVRGRSEFDAGHLPDALNFTHTRLADHLDELPADRRFAVYCATGFRAAAASSLLERHGRDVVYVDDSFRQWEAGGGEVVR